MVSQSHCHCRTALLIAPPIRKPLGFLLNAGCGRIQLCSNKHNTINASHVSGLLANPWVFRSTHSDDPARPRSTAPHKPHMGTTAAPHHGTDFHAHNPPPPPLLDGLSEPHARGRNQGWASPLPGPLRVPIDPHDLRAIDTSPIADPGNSAISRRSLTGQLNRQGALRPPRAKRPGHHEAGGAVPGSDIPTEAHPARRACWLSRVWALFLQ